MGVRVFLLLGLRAILMSDNLEPATCLLGLNWCSKTKNYNVQINVDNVNKTEEKVVAKNMFC